NNVLTFAGHLWTDTFHKVAAEFPEVTTDYLHVDAATIFLVTDEPGLWLALGEAVNGPGGYFGGDFHALHDCLGGDFGFTAPATLTWRNADVARAHLSRALAPEGEPYDLFAAVVDALEQDGMRVVLA
ncbi:barstar family protein, partial [Streptomyces venezuelae]|uniref:barstar family protein n=1 Tax=Streptomyces venezuelae TaxID=54571 RepID=UPI001F1DFB4E